jgi:short-subunit dehydrogenase
MITSWIGQRVLVTGASSGIGAAIARDLARQGATVGLCARRAELLDGVLEDCRRTSPSSQAWRVDLSELDQLTGFVRRVEDAFGGIDVLINNAGVIFGQPALATDLDSLEAQLRINYLSPVLLTQAALPAMRARGSGHVVVVSSMAARTSTPGEAAYAAAKSALTAYFEALAAELWFEQVHFHLVFPALIDRVSGIDGDDELAESSTGADLIPAPVTARAIRGQLERGDLELYIPRTMAPFVAGRYRDIPKAIEFMAGLYRDGALH